MKALLTAAALSGIIALSGCAGAPQGAPASASSASAAATATAAPSTAPAQEKVHFTGDYTKTTPADSAEILELSRQWYSAEKKTTLKAKMEAAGLSSNIPAEIAPTWYTLAATACQAKFDGHPIVVEGAYAEIDKLVLSTYCPELG